MYERVLVPTDGSDVARRAYEHAVRLAEIHGAEIHALYVVDVDALGIGLGVEQVDRIRQGKFGEMEELEARARDATDEVASLARDHGVDCVTHVSAGRPHAVVADYADDHDIDLIVMGSHGRAGVSRAILGSVTERTLRATRRPVLVVDGRADA
jgi:nucleotide-binding universal stress UspA family protein